MFSLSRNIDKVQLEEFNKEAKLHFAKIGEKTTKSSSKREIRKITNRNPIPGDWSLFETDFIIFLFLFLELLSNLRPLDLEYHIFASAPRTRTSTKQL